MPMLRNSAHHCVLLGLLAVGPGRSSSSGVSLQPSTTRSVGQATPLILGAQQGERRIRRTLGGAPLIIKVDARNGGAPEFVMGMEEIPVGEAIPPHHHLDTDEIVVIQRGTGWAQVGEQVNNVSAGATIYIPRRTRITLRNTGAEPLAIAFFFSKPGFEDYLRDTSVPEGQVVHPLSASELAAIRQRYEHHVVYEKR